MKDGRLIAVLGGALMIGALALRRESYAQGAVICVGLLVLNLGFIFGAGRNKS